MLYVDYLLLDIWRNFVKGESSLFNAPDRFKSLLALLVERLRRAMRIFNSLTNKLFVVVYAKFA